MISEAVFAGLVEGSRKPIRRNPGTSSSLSSSSSAAAAAAASGEEEGGGARILHLEKYTKMGSQRGCGAVEEADVYSIIRERLEGLECSICMNSQRSGFVSLHGCGHTFHRDCFSKWWKHCGAVRRRRFCPFCRQRLFAIPTMKNKNTKGLEAQGGMISSQSRRGMAIGSVEEGTRIETREQDQWKGIREETQILLAMSNLSTQIRDIQTSSAKVSQRAYRKSAALRGRSRRRAMKKKQTGKRHYT